MVMLNTSTFRICQLTTIACLFVLVAFGLKAQPINNLVKDVVMPAPNAASLGKYGDIPVSYFTGVPSISIPIYNVQCGPLSLPISLNYHASGIKIGEPASWVGLGWSLDAGGMISRSVLGIPDESTLGYLTVGEPDLTLNNGINQTIEFIAQGIKDGEPDLFSFNIGGYSGKFMFDKDGNYHIIPKQDLKLEWKLGTFSTTAYQNEFVSFTMTTPDGTRYIFGQLPSESGNMGAEITSDDLGGMPFVTSSWVLRKIESYDKKYSINLAYLGEEYSYKMLSSCRWNVMMCPAGGNSSVSCSGTSHSVLPFTNYIRFNVKGMRLNQITTSTNTTTVNFIANTDRSDLEESIITPSTTSKNKLDEACASPWVK